MTTSNSDNDTNTLESVRSDYACAVATLLNIARELSKTQVNDHYKVRALVDRSRQALQTIVACADPVVLDACETER